MITNETTFSERGNLYRGRMVEVKPHIGRRRPIVSLPKELTEYRRLGGAMQTDEERDFVSKNVSSGRIILMPDKEKELQQIENRARNLCKRSLLVQDYMLHDVYLEVKGTFNEQMEEYFAKRDEIDLIWEECVMDFSRGLLGFVSSCGVPHEDVVMWHKNLMKQLPSHNEWKKSFFFRLEAREFPAEPGTLPGMDEQWREHTRELARTLIANQLTDLFGQAAKIMKKISARDIVAKPVGKMLDAARSIRNTNMIQEKEMLDVAEMFLKLQAIDPDTDIDGFSEELECCMGSALSLADSYDIDLPLSLLPGTLDKNYLVGLAA